LSTLIDASLYAALGFLVDIVSSGPWVIVFSTADVDIVVERTLENQKKVNQINEACGVPTNPAPGARSARRRIPGLAFAHVPPNVGAWRPPQAWHSPAAA
jgi:hypothetical protein